MLGGKKPNMLQLVDNLCRYISKSMIFINHRKMYYVILYIIYLRVKVNICIDIQKKKNALKMKFPPPE